MLEDLRDKLKELERKLTSGGLDLGLVQNVRRQFESQHEAECLLVTNAFRALSAYHQRAEEFLTAMKKSWGDWRTDPATGELLFENPAARRAYENSWKPVEKQCAAYFSAAKAWLAARAR